MLVDFKRNYEDFGKKGNVLSKLDALLKSETKVIIPETLIIPVSFFNNKVRNRLYLGVELLTFDEKQEILKEIRKRFRNKKVVVRSSASCEDSILFTNSGQYDSFLNLVSDAEIICAIEKIYYSFISENARKYSEINNVTISNEGMAVLIQEVAPVYRAGVMFTSNPVTGQDIAIIEFCDGLGEAVVAGQSRVTRLFETDLQLSKVFKRLIRIGKLIEEEMGSPQDIEWGIDIQNDIYIFQARPIVMHHRECRDFAPFEAIGYGSQLIISKGFTIGRVSDELPYKLIVQDGKLTSKDLIPIMDSKGIILRTGGMLSHFANIVREFNKPCIIIEDKIQVNADQIYVLNAYDGSIAEFEGLAYDVKVCAIWNYACDLVLNSSANYKEELGIKKHSFFDAMTDCKYCSFELCGRTISVQYKGRSLELEFLTKELALKFFKGVWT